MTGSGQSHNFLDDKTNTGKGIVIMDRNTTKYKVKQYIMFAGISTVLFAAVVIIPFIYGLYLTFTSWDGISKDKQFVGFANYIATFKDIAYWQALGRTVIYSVISVVLVNVVAFFLAYLLTSGIKGQNFFRAGFFIPNLIGGIVLGYIWSMIFNGKGSFYWCAFKFLAGNTERCNGMFDYCFCMAVCRLHDVNLCCRIYECTEELKGSCSD